MPLACEPSSTSSAKPQRSCDRGQDNDTGRALPARRGDRARRHVHGLQGVRHGARTTGGDQADAQGDRHREAALHNNLADLLHAAGQAEKAMLHLKQAVSIYAEIGVEAGTVQPEIWKLVEW